MKICWDMLEGVCLTKNGNFKRNRAVYAYGEACKICGEPYLFIKSRHSVFCSRKCVMVNRKLERAYNFIDITGQRFGRYIVQKYVYTKKKFSYYKCRCECGNEKIVRGNDLRSGRTQSCGCLMRELASQRAKGKPKSEETKRKLSETMMGRVLPVERVEQIREYQKERYTNGEHVFCTMDLSNEKNPNYKHGLTDTKAYNSAKSAKRRAIKLDQTPSDADLEEISKIYKICEDMNECAKNVVLPKRPHSGAWFHVDHEIPLSKGGLHHEDNLQVMWWTDNLSKHTKILEGKGEKTNET